MGSCLSGSSQPAGTEGGRGSSSGRGGGGEAVLKKLILKKLPQEYLLGEEVRGMYLFVQGKRNRNRKKTKKAETKEISYLQGMAEKGWKG